MTTSWTRFDPVRHAKRPRVQLHQQSAPWALRETRTSGLVPGVLLAWQQSGKTTAAAAAISAVPLKVKSANWQLVLKSPPSESNRKPLDYKRLVCRGSAVAAGLWLAEMTTELRSSRHASVSSFGHEGSAGGSRTGPGLGRYDPRALRPLGALARASRGEGDRRHRRWCRTIACRSAADDNLGAQLVDSYGV
jgi:hypothetical protein